MKMKGFSRSFVFLFFSLFLILAGCSESNVSNGDSDGKNESVVIKVGHIAPDSHSYTKGLEEFAKAVEEETDGRVKFEIYGNGQLGGEVEVVEQVQLGVLDMTLVTSGPVGNFVEEYNVLEMPFLFRDLDHVYKTLDGEIGKEIIEKLDAAGFKTLGLWENGFRHLASDKPIKSPDDMKGLKMRTVENPIYVETYSALGADPTPIAFPELYTSLQQGVVNGSDLSYGVMHSTKMYEVQDYFSEVGIYYASAPLLMNKDKFQSLPEDVQKVLIEKGKEFTKRQREINQEMEKEQKEDLIANGVTIIEKSEVDIEAFQKAVEKVYKDHSSRFGDLVERIQNVK